MIDANQTDEQIRNLYEENAARLDVHAFKAELADRLSSRPKRLSPRALRVISFAALGIVLVAAIGFGIYTAARSLGQSHPIVVITDDTIPGTSGSSLSSEEAYALAEELLVEIPDLGFKVRRAWGAATYDNDVTWITLGPDEPMQAFIDIYIQSGLASFPNHAVLAGEATEIAIPGATAALSVASPDGDYRQVVALTPDGTSINAISRGTLTDAELVPPPLDQERLVGLVRAAIALKTSEIATAQAETTLREFFQAWAAKDVAAWKALLSESRQRDMNLGDWTFADLDHIEFGPVTAAPEVIDPWLRGGDRGVTSHDVRCFRASVTFYYEPGVVGSNDSGAEYPWMWFLVRDVDGHWGVSDWGA